MLPENLINHPVMEAPINLFGQTRAQLENYFSDLGEQKFRASQLMKWVYQFGKTDFSSMTNFSKSLREMLAVDAELVVPTILSEHQSIDGTIKWLVKVDDKNSIEMVFIPEESRGTLCISSQVGCALNCSFCATGKQGFNRNLSTAEIIGQVWLAAAKLKHNQSNRVITNIVMMGMGEPLLNYDDVVAAINIMQDDFAYGFAHRKVTVSTAGYVPGILKLAQDCDVSLAISLHAPEDNVRNQLVPINKKYPLQTLLSACHQFLAGKHKHKVTFEYTMLADINDSIEHAKKLVKLIANIPCKVNLIPFNPFPGTDYLCSKPKVIKVFQQILMDYGIVATIRKTRGQDIDAACGQLAGKFYDRTRRKQLFLKSVSI